MIRTGSEYIESLKDNREVYINGERVKDITVHPQFKPLVDIRARFYDMQHEIPHKEVMTYSEDGETSSIANKLPRTEEDWWAKRRATDTLLNEVGELLLGLGTKPLVKCGRYGMAKIF